MINLIGKDEIGVAQGSGVMETCKVGVENPLPCIVILIHGVNDIGEAFENQDKAICKGLNKRLGRCDLVANEWETIQTNPDNLAPRINIKKANYSPVIPFFWGYRPVDKEKYDEEQRAYYKRLQDPNVEDPELPYDSYWVDRDVEVNNGNVDLKKLNCDKFGNWIDYNYHRNGGPFADATTCIPDMYGPGMSGYLAELGKVFTPKGAKSYDNPHRIYFAFAAHRLAKLIETIRSDDANKDVPINIVAHSQGTIITILANLLLAKENTLPADCTILAHSPYAFEPAYFEILSKDLGMGVQSQYGRETTFINFVEKMQEAQNDLRTIEFDNLATLIEEGVISSVDNKNEKYYQADNSVKHYERLGKDSELFYRNNFGKVYNYFSPNDHVVSLYNVQGMGWQGIPDHIFKQCTHKNLKQRIFSHGHIAGNNTKNSHYTVPLILLRLEEHEYPNYINLKDFKQRQTTYHHPYRQDMQIPQAVPLLLDQLEKLKQEPKFKHYQGEFVSGYYAATDGKSINIRYKPSQAELERDYPELIYQKIGSRELKSICIDSERNWELEDRQLLKTLSAQDQAEAFVLAKEKCESGNIATGWDGSTVSYSAITRLINGEEVPEPIIYTVDKPTGKTKLSQAIHYNDIHNSNNEIIERIKRISKEYPIPRPDYIPFCTKRLTGMVREQILDKAQLLQLENAHPEWDKGIRAAYYCANDDVIIVYAYLTEAELKQQMDDLLGNSDDSSSHHSGITMNEKAPSNIVAYDLAIGIVKGNNIKDKFYYWRSLADWRHPDNPDDEVSEYINYGSLPPNLKKAMNYPHKNHMPINGTDLVVNDFFHSMPIQEQIQKLKEDELAQEKYKKLSQPAQWPMPNPDLKGVKNASN